MSDRLKTPRNSEAGVGVDRFGERAFDPSANVTANTKAAVKRLDDLREAAVQRNDDLREAAETLGRERFRHTEFVARLRATHSKEMRDSDNERLAAQRREDQATALADKKTVLDAVQTLATTTESVRLQLEKRVADSAETLAKAKSESDKATEVRVSALEKIAFTGAGEKAVSDPAMVLLAQSVADLAKVSTGAGGERRGNERMWAALAIAVSVLTAVGSLLFAVLKP